MNEYLQKLKDSEIGLPRASHRTMEMEAVLLSSRLSSLLLQANSVSLSISIDPKGLDTNSYVSFISDLDLFETLLILIPTLPPRSIQSVTTLAWIDLTSLPAGSGLKMIQTTCTSYGSTHTTESLYVSWSRIQRNKHLLMTIQTPTYAPLIHHFSLSTNQPLYIPFFIPAFKTKCVCFLFGTFLGGFWDGLVSADILSLWLSLYC